MHVEPPPEVALGLRTRREAARPRPGWWRADGDQPALDDHAEGAAARRRGDRVAGRGLDREALLLLQAPARELELRRVVVPERPG